jgi:hypothetical protein
MESKLQSIYFDVKHPASFGTAEKLKAATKSKYNKQDITRWLQAQDAHTLHKERRIHFTRSRYFVPSMNNLFQCDLCDMRNLVTYNEGYKFILTVIDVFSKKAWAIPLKNKTAESVINALNVIFKQNKPTFIQTDKGKEFVAAKVQKFLKENGIKFYTTNNPDTKAAVVERFNKTLKNKMYKYFTHASTLKYIDVLDDLLHSYNNTVHSATNKAPNQVNKLNERDVFLYLYSGRGRYKKIQFFGKPLFKIGDKVRITREKYTFEQGYKSNWSTEIFVVSQIIRRSPIRYKIKDLNGEIIEGSFYAQELQPVETSSNTFYKVDKILKERGKGNSRELYVSWVGYPPSFNSWIPASNLKRQ